MLEGVKRRTSMCQAYYCTFHLRESISFQSTAIFLCPKGTTQISHGISTKLWNQYETAVKFVRE